MQKQKHQSYESFTLNQHPDHFRELCPDLPENYNAGFDLLEKMAREKPDALCIRHLDEHGARRDVTFAALNEAACRVASALKKLGLGKGDRVFLMLFRRLEWWEAMLGLHKLGAVAIPAPAQLTAHDIEYRLNKAGAKAVLAEHSLCARVDEAAAQCPALLWKIRVGADFSSRSASSPESAPASGPKSAFGASPSPAAPSGRAAWLDYAPLLQAAASSFPRPENPADLASGRDPLLIFFSSGTTGMPKMVLHDHLYPLGHAFTGLYWHDLEPGDLHLTLADTGWGKAIWGKSYGQWMAGAAVLVWDFRGKFEPAALLRILENEGVTSFCAPPTVYRFLIREDVAAYDLSRLRHCTTAGELLNESVFHAWKEKTGLPLYEGYGQTETCLSICALPCMEVRPGSIGKPVPGWQVRLLREDGSLCAPGEEGEICINVAQGTPPGLFSSYLDEQERQDKVLYDGWYHTGDKAWMDQDGYYWFLGRVDDLIKSSGYRIGPFEVESALVAHPAVIEAAVTGVPDEARGQIVKATVVLAPGYAPGEALTRELQNHVKTSTAPYKYPRLVEYVEELPKTISGKIKRAEIRAADTRALAQNLAPEAASPCRGGLPKTQAAFTQDAGGKCA